MRLTSSIASNVNQRQISGVNIMRGLSAVGAHHRWVSAGRESEAQKNVSLWWAGFAYYKMSNLIDTVGELHDQRYQQLGG